MRTLYGLKVSPWTERARWALDHHKLPFEYHEHVPLIGELLLRRKAKVSKASVPLLQDGETVVMGSADIGRHADKVGNGAKLFPSAEVDHFVDLAETIVDVGRAWYMRRLLASKEALAEVAPSFVPNALRGVMAPSVKMGINYLGKKYNVPKDVEPEVANRMRPALDEVRAKLKGDYLLGDFSFADIAIASALGGVRPWSGTKQGPASRECWNNEKVAADYADLLEWRDKVYAKHRTS